LFGSSQHYRDDEDNDPTVLPQKLGIKIGVCPSWINAPEMHNGRYQLGLQGGFYYRVHLNRKKNYHLHTEFTANFRGARFNNDDGYTRLGLFYLDLPVYLMYSFDSKHDRNLMIGPVFSHLVRPTMFLGNELFPTFTDLPFKKFDVSIGAAYLRSFELIGLSLGFKYGMLNIVKSNLAEFGTPGGGGSNGWLYLKDVKPSLVPVKTITNLSFELSLYF
jgi:hypothetical protein